jgi:HD-GYP domain-containing protein (c-di-GMP phosphodiesterase class II)
MATGRTEASGELRPAARAVVGGLDAVAAMLSSDARFSDYAVSRPHPLVLLVRKGDKTVLLAPGSVWDRGRDVLRPYVTRFVAGNAMLILLGRVQEPDLDRVINKGLAALLDAEPTKQMLYVAIGNAFQMMTARARAESRGKWLNRYRYELGELVEIARMMSTEQETDKLLGLILEKARFITNADAGSIYVVEGTDPDMSRRVLRFKLTQNDSVKFDWREFTIPVSVQSIAGATAMERKSINIADVYDLPPGTPYAVDRSFDEKISYRTTSMLCVPLVNKSANVIGVLQLINKKKDPSARLLGPEDFAQQVVPFDERSQSLLEAMAAQAGISLENAMLYEEILRIFEGFVHASVEAIEQRDPTTSGHSRRVADLSIGLAEALERVEIGPYRSVRFGAQDLNELKYAALLHDFGKIGVREEVLVKAKKLYPADLARIRSRFDYAMRSFEVGMLRRKLEAIERGASQQTLEALDQEFQAKIDEINGAWEAVTDANQPTVLSEDRCSRVEALTRSHYHDVGGQLQPLLTDEELVNLKIPRGSLNASEIDEIRSHVTHTFSFLERIPWGSNFRRIPLIAGAHHERLNGTGYPKRLRAEEIPLQSKIMTVADIFDALTASDRPYKKAVPIERALFILDAEVNDSHIDGELVRVFNEAKIWERVFEQTSSS